MVNIARTIPLADAWGMHGVGGGWMISMMAVMLLFWGAIIFGVVWLIRGGFDGRPGRRESPIDVLERRFAEGAISVDDYAARRDVLVHGTAESNDARKDEPLTASQPAEGRQQ